MLVLLCFGPACEASSAFGAEVRGITYVAPPPPVASGPVNRQLIAAYRSVVRAPGALSAHDANAAYLAARQAAARGDFSEALADAAAAQAAALEPGFAPLPGPFSVAPLAGEPASASPSVWFGASAAGDSELGSAATEITIAGDAGVAGPALDAAKQHERAALEAFARGDARRMRTEARAALDLATEAITNRT